MLSIRVSTCSAFSGLMERDSVRPTDAFPAGLCPPIPSPVLMLLDAFCAHLRLCEASLEKANATASAATTLSSSAAAERSTAGSRQVGGRAWVTAGCVRLWVTEHHGGVGARPIYHMVLPGKVPALQLDSVLTYSTGFPRP